MSAIDRALSRINQDLPEIHARRAAWEREAIRQEREENAPRRLARQEAERLVYGRVSPGWREGLE